MISRDSYVLWVGVLAAVVGYLTVSEAPWLWDYADWLKAAAFGLGLISTKLMTSPLKGENDAGKVNVNNLTGGTP